MADRGASLLLLREADIVRLCGLAAAAQALDVLRAGGVTGGSKVGPRLSARVRAEGAEEYTPWLESGGETTPQFAWGCSCPHGEAVKRQTRAAGAGGHLACVHVAALLTLWVRHPASFREEHPQLGAPAAPAPPARRADTGAQRVPALDTPAVDATQARAGSLRDQLSRLSQHELRHARRRVLGEPTDAPTEGEHLLTALSAALTDPVLLAALCATLDEAALLLLRGLLLSGGALTDAALAAIGARAGLSPAAQIVARHELRACCLLFPIGDTNAPAGWSIPSELLSQLDIGLGLPPLDRAAIAGPQIPSGAREDGDTAADVALRALCATVTLMAYTHGQVRPSGAAAERGATGGDLPPARGDAAAGALEAWARAANMEVGVSRFAYRLVHMTMSRAGILHPMLTLDRLPAQEWACALKMAVGAWLDSPTYAELADLRAIDVGIRVRCDPRHAAFSQGAVATENAHARAAIARLLARVRPGVWYAIDDFVAFVWQLDPYFLRGRQRAFETPVWWIEDALTGRPLRSGIEMEWRRAEGRYIYALMAGPLRWLGLVELTREGEGVAQAFQSTEWASYLLGESADVPSGAVRLARGWGKAIQPAGASGIAIQPLALAPNGTAPLDAWAEVTGVRGGRLLWRMSVDRFCANLDAHHRAGELLDWLHALDARDGTRSAQALAAVLERWQRQYGDSRVQRDVIIVEARDDVSLREALAAVPELAAEARVLAPGVAALPRRHAGRLEQALTQRGYLV